MAVEGADTITLGGPPRMNPTMPITKPLPRSHSHFPPVSPNHSPTPIPQTPEEV
ncbi:hypothetical protein FA13DRAFT_1741452 [Coprinellus micaceus]|uniref:Uncharacterized protein n=1 Tax=Coprinellus micaceus TaxID=71717 RepID=A0A4Y7SJY2_COPMI|nr:hypothetical protein FA13DRAFT_1741452 [Coprinellus micaceus]